MRRGDASTRARAAARQAAARRLVAEFLGTAFLLAAIIGSGIVTQQDGAASAQLFQHTVVVGLALTALILTFGPISGAHFNPAVTLVDAAFGGLPWRRAGGYVVVQVAGALAGTMFTHASFGLPLWQVASTDRGGLGMIAGEAAATLGLLLVIFGLVRSGGGRVVAGAVGAYIGAAIYFTSSASFANPAVTVARVLSDTYTGIAPVHVPAFLVGQLLGALLAIGLVAWLFAPDASAAAEVIVPHDPAAGEPDPASDPAAPATADPSAGPVLSATSVPRSPAKGSTVSTVPSVLFLCVHNAGRSQMAAGFLRHLGGDSVQVMSGGSEPADAINPAAVEAMAEKGIDIAGQQPRPWTDESVGAADVVVSMGCGDACPVLPGKRYIDWDLDDPAGKGVDAVRPIRDDIEQRVRALMGDLGVTPHAT